MCPNMFTELFRGNNFYLRILVHLLVGIQIVTADLGEEECGLREVLKDDMRTLSPWTVSIFIRPGEHKPWEYLLAGTIISPTTILTLYGGEFGSPTRGSNYYIPKNDNVKIVAGLLTTSLSSKDYFTQEANVSFIMPFTNHEADNKVFHLYLVHLSSELKFDTPFVKAICLQEIFDPPDTINDNFYLGGYAPLNGSKGMKGLEVKEINLLVDTVCNEEFQKLYNGSSNHVFCGRQNIHFESKETCLHHGATLAATPIREYQNPREARWYLMGILAMIPSLKYNQCNRDTLYMLTSLEDSLRWIWQNIGCGPNKFTCISGDCIPLNNVCDGIPNCGDSGGIRKSNDENAIYCGATNPCKGSDVYFHQCGLHQECISPLQICDGRKDCQNGADENPGVCSLDLREVVALQEVKQENKIRRRGANSTCPPVQLTEGVIATCKNLGNNKAIPCSEAMVNDEMSLQCDIQYKPTSRASSSKMKCGSDGSWKPYRPFYCERECGIINSGLTFHLSFATRTTHALAFPWYTAIFRNQSGVMEFICGGSLVEPKVVITAAHCVTRAGEVMQPDIFEIVVAPVGADFNENRKDAFSQIISVKEIHVPATFSPLNLQSDLAILELRKPVVFSDFVLPVCYLPPFYTDYPTQGLLGKVTGLGYDENNQLSPVVKFAEFPVVDQSVCKKALGHTMPLNTFCAGFQNGTSVCKGDSGGGLVFPVISGQQSRYVLKGIVSHGLLSANRVCDRENYSVFTHVDAFSEWISSTIAKLNIRRKRFNYQ